MPEFAGALFDVSGPAQSRDAYAHLTDIRAVMDA
jgi:hypothetical protein